MHGNCINNKPRIKLEISEGNSKRKKKRKTFVIYVKMTNLGGYQNTEAHTIIKYSTYIKDKQTSYNIFVHDSQ